MRWLVHGNVLPAVADALRRHGHTVQNSTEAGVSAESLPADVLAAAQKQQLELMTADPALAEAPFAEGASFNRLVVYLKVPTGEEELDDAVDRFLERYPRPSAGRFYTVTASRVKVRQLPASKR